MNDKKASFDDYLMFFKSLGLIEEDIDNNTSLINILRFYYDFSVHAVVLKRLLSIDPFIYKSALYNYTTHKFIIACIDNGYGFINKNILDNLNINKNPVNGIVQNASDNTTAASMLVPDFYKNISSFDLDTLRTPYGREYFNIMQQYGSIWGLN